MTVSSMGQGRLPEVHVVPVFRQDTTAMVTTMVTMTMIMIMMMVMRTMWNLIQTITPWTMYNVHHC